MQIVDITDPQAEILLENIFSREPEFSGSLEKDISQYIRSVKEDGDRALVNFISRFDGIETTPDKIRIPPERIKEAHDSVNKPFLTALRAARENIERFHKAQKQESYTFDDGDCVRLGLRYTSIEKVGLYVPGGEAGYPSSILMNAIPAMIAGVERIVVVTPPKRFSENPYVGAALWEMGLTEVYGIGGAHAIAALAFGTETVPRVDKIVGPGNIYVAIAKRLVYGFVDIDMIAGPSEIVVIADESANPVYVAADLLSQAEHGSGLELSILITDSRELADKVNDEVYTQVRKFMNSEKIEEVLDRNVVVIVEKIQDAVSVANRIAPEHLEIMVSDPDPILDKIRNAGAIFIGEHSPESVGDYYAGPNHVLPTGGSARFRSPLGVYDFQKCSTIEEYSYSRLKKCGPDIIRLAEAEGFTAHANAVRVRLEQYKKHDIE